MLEMPKRYDRAAGADRNRESTVTTSYVLVDDAAVMDVGLGGTCCGENSRGSSARSTSVIGRRSCACTAGRPGR